jgi:signal transduction histidine kinase
VGLIPVATRVGTVGGMVRDQMRAARRMAARPQVDWAIAVAFLVATEAELWSFRPYPGAAGRLGAVVVAAGSSLPLAWRRRRPLLALVVVAATLAAPAHLLFHRVARGTGPAAPFLALLLAAFSAGAYARPRTPRWHVVLFTAAIAAVMVVDALQGRFDGGSWLAAAIFLLIGALYRQRLARVSQLENETTRLRHDRAVAAQAAAADERARIARELHDVVAHSVSVMTVQAGAARHTLDPADTDTREALASIEVAGRQALVELRRLLGILRRADDEPALAPVPSLAQVGELLADMRAAGLAVTLRVEGEPVALPPGVDLAAYRIVQEALTNSLKHAPASRTEVHICYGRHEMLLSVADDGVSASVGPSSGGTGHGLIGMRERVLLYGGTLQAGPRPEGGFGILARLPLDGVRR